jgi:hypothetical protein
MANVLTFEAYYDPGTGAAWTALGATDKVYFQKSGSFAYGVTGAIPINTYNGGTHVIDASNNQLDTTTACANIAYGSDANHYSKDGGADTLIDASNPATTDCFRVHGNCSPNAQVTASSIFAYDGTTEANPVADVTVDAVVPGVGAGFASIGGSAAALDLGTSASAADHYRYVAITVSPTANGAKSGTIKSSMTFV